MDTNDINKYITEKELDKILSLSKLSLSEREKNQIITELNDMIEKTELPDENFTKGYIQADNEITYFRNDQKEANLYFDILTQTEIKVPNIIYGGETHENNWNDNSGS